ncbi:MAG: hypothetical protein DRO88_08480 [Promethearchaeia archaeon]|nr:MAG: hypothetical protein DRO88_08480 [Candidatus Lokiarchaeia archaeon]
MAILELAILYQNNPLFEKQFYSTSNVLDKKIRNSLLQTISGVINEAFGEEIQSFSLGKYTITVLTHPLGDPDNSPSNLDKSHNNSALKPLMMYCIVDQNSDDKIVLKTMKEAMLQFCNRFSVYDISQNKVKKFKKFDKRLDKIFGDLILKSEDRFKSLF